MKDKIYFIKNIVSSLLLVVIILSASSCEDLFKDPLKDKETGKDITVLLLDRNFIKTKLKIWFVDAKTGELLEDEFIELQIWGDNADRLITFEGEKPETFTTNIGFLELGYDPNFVVNVNDPLAITLMAVGQSSISAPQFLRYTQEGTKDIIIQMNSLITGYASKSGAFGEPFDISYNGSINSSDLHFVTDLSSSPTGTAYEYINLYLTLIPGNILCDNLQDPLLYDDYGIYYASQASGESLVPPAEPVKTKSLASGDYIFSTILKSGVAMCQAGLTIAMDREDAEPGTGSFNYIITFSNGNTKSGLISGSFPMEHLIEPIYYPEADPTVMVQVFDDTQYNVSGPVNLSDACEGLAQFTVTPKSNLRTYKFINQYICPDDIIGYALSVSGQFRRAETIEPWTSFEFVEGICELELVEGVDYDFRVAIDDEFQYYTLPTDPDQLEQFLIDHQGEEYTIQELAITPLESKTEVFAVVEVSSSVCESLSGGGIER